MALLVFSILSVWQLDLIYLDVLLFFTRWHISYQEQQICCLRSWKSRPTEKLWSRCIHVGITPNLDSSVHSLSLLRNDQKHTWFPENRHNIWSVFPLGKFAVRHHSFAKERHKAGRGFPVVAYFLIFAMQLFRYAKYILNTLNHILVWQVWR